MFETNGNEFSLSGWLLPEEIDFSGALKADEWVLFKSVVNFVEKIFSNDWLSHDFRV